MSEAIAVQDHPVRKAISEDLPFIFDSWLQTFRRSPFATGIPGPIYFQRQRARIVRLLLNCSVLIAHARGSPEVILGYLVRDEKAPVLHYLYAKGAMRRLGLGSVLIAAASLECPLEYTHLTRDGQLFAKQRAGWQYNPFLAG